ncbi:hypothetical protein [Snodgrassella alvi]|jgi:hypothetical protein|uniref:Uncharacterized protein n=1 Tax=Snodgrassella alvi TaxID=1196083 RepID=A0A2N9XZ53_9NEIS|nr:hypothetical protein [Snodgrassella alvi]PIT14809.1 hypothetical protein BGI32_06915 [Snodgrassella alvi]PIT15571.1 hypothetical protein BGI33_05975 [Snodgrassella alvi]PIT18157.1 hypothetical protein BGI34_05445 [Snodgrassella alvi]PIT56278.1 hypothetical protein BHC49_04755 [Snodgrassella alvi]
MVYELKISDNYSDSYWFEYEQSEFSNIDLIQGKKIRLDNPLNFELKKKVSEKKLLSFDYFLSDGPDFISPRLATLLADNKDFLKDVQLLDANVVINGKNYSGFKVLNILRMLSCIDMDKSDSVPILDHLPDGPKRFTQIVFRNDVIEDFYMARCLEYKYCVVISEKLRQLFIENNVKGIEL